MNRTLLKKAALCCGLLIASPFIAFGQIHEGGHRPDWNAIDTISFLSFNDFHGAFVKDRNVPGAAELVQAVLDEKAKNKNTVVVSVEITSAAAISPESRAGTRCRGCLGKWMSRCRQ